jgi:ABC-type transport system involved in multi-copper enzyme maturation permease subunit
VPLIFALVGKEFHTWLRGKLAFLAFALLVTLLSLLVFFLALLILAPDANAAPALFSTTANTTNSLLVSNRALFLFGAVACSVLITAGVAGSTIASSAFAAERERGMLDVLLLQSAGAFRIVLTKVLAAVLFTLLLLVAALPLFAAPWMFGGVQAEHLWAFLTVLLSSTLLFCALGVCLGALLRGTLQAMLFAQGLTLFLLFGTLGLFLGPATLANADGLRPLLWLNPLLALLSGGGSATDAFARSAPAAYRGVLSLPPQSWAPGLLLPAWVIGSLAWTALAVLLVLGAAIAIEPTHPLKARRAAAGRSGA